MASCFVNNLPQFLTTSDLNFRLDLTKQLAFLLLLIFCECDTLCCLFYTNQVPLAPALLFIIFGQSLDTRFFLSKRAKDLTKIDFYIFLNQPKLVWQSQFYLFFSSYNYNYTHKYYKL